MATHIRNGSVLNMKRRLALVVAIGVLWVDKNNKHAVVRQEPVGKQDKESVIMAFISYC